MKRQNSGLLLFITGLLASWAWVFTSGDRDYENIFTLVIVVVVSIDSYRTYTKGLDDMFDKGITEDEMSLRIKHEAGLYAYAGTLMMLALLSFMHRYGAVDVNDNMLVPMLLALVIGAFCRNYISRKYRKYGDQL